MSIVVLFEATEKDGKVKQGESKQKNTTSSSFSLLEHQILDVFFFKFSLFLKNVRIRDQALDKIVFSNKTEFLKASERKL